MEKYLLSTIIILQQDIACQVERIDKYLYCPMAFVNATPQNLTWTLFLFHACNSEKVRFVVAICVADMLV